MVNLSTNHMRSHEAPRISVTGDSHLRFDKIINGQHKEKRKNVLKATTGMLS
jgi:hypothetical protein